MQLPKCEKLFKKVQKLSVKRVSLIFPSAYINSPASMYGHTFLRFDKNLDTPLVSNALNYSAQTAETSGIAFAYKGLLGGYRGYYSTMAYYEKIQEYNDLEQRDIWEYNLNLNQAEINRMLLHIFEVERFYSDYYFIDENCSYNLLWLIEVARPSLDLVDRFKYVVLPIDTIREIIDQGVVDSTFYRESQLQKMQYILEEKIKDKKLAKKFMDDPSISLDHLDRLQQIYILDLAALYIPYRAIKEKKVTKDNKKEFLRDQLSLLKKRSKLGKSEKYDFPKADSPLKTHLSSKFELFANSNESVDIGIKLAYHDIYDIETSFVEGAYIDFFHLTLNQTKDKTRLKSFKILNMKSFAKRDLLFKPVSWGVEFGLENFYEQNRVKLKGDVGLTYGDKGYYYFLDLNPTIYYKDDTLFGLGGTFGLIQNLKDMKIGATFNETSFEDDIYQKHIEIFSTKEVFKSSAIGLKYSFDELEVKDIKETDEYVSLYYFYYF